MRTLYLLIVIYVALILTGCAHQTPVYRSYSSDSSAEEVPCHHHKNPVTVSFLKKVSPNVPYRVLGEAKVSKYNTEGIKRQEATIRDLMREQAASLDGDAVIDIKKDDKMITATVIAYKKVLA